MAALLALVLVVYAGDWLVWRLRAAAGSGMDQVEVNRLSITPLKGKKEIYDFDGADTVACTRSLWPPLTLSGWGTPCWYRRSHREIVTRY